MSSTKIENEFWAGIPEEKRPRHIAMIMDGNGRWANSRGLKRILGHREGAKAVRKIVESCRFLGVEVLTLYAFSSQNWSRPADEVSGLMALFDFYIKKERDTLLNNGVRMQVIGNRSQLDPALLNAIETLESMTAHCDDMVLQLAVSYGGREELIQAVQKIAADVVDGHIAPEDVDEASVQKHLYTCDAPDPDLVIRTSGEFRVSNFLLWQIAYSEFYVTDTLWPDFDERELLNALDAFSERERRFGKTGAQIKDESLPG